MLRQLVLALLVLGVRAQFRVDPLVETKVGLIRGVKNNEGFSMFLGVPYAKVNESNVFGPSIPVTKFESTFNALDDSAVCAQIEISTGVILGSLDCLTLNIYVPDSASTANPLPVMVWIHGGGFEMGSAVSSTTGPQYLVRHNVVLVTIQYRLGPYGFLCLDTPEVPGNQGLKDQHIALRWIKDNIGAFGGNSNRITLFGSSAGAMSIDLHLLSEHELLFHKVIMQSGAATTPGYVRESDASVPLQISAHLGFVTEDLAEALAFISKAEVELVLGAGRELFLEFRPCPEKDFVGVEKFVADFAINTPVPKAKSVSILSGYNSYELGMLSVINVNFESDIFAQSLDMTFDFGADIYENERFVRHFYIGDEPVSGNVSSGIADFLSDFAFNYPVQWTTERYMRNGARNVYYYVFSYPGDQSWGAGHGDEHVYLFASDVDLSDEKQLIRDRMTAMWTNFAKHGDPTPNTSELLPIKWTPATESTLNYLDINKEMIVATRPFRSRMAFWELYFRSNWEKLRGYRNMGTA